MPKRLRDYANTILQGKEFNIENPKNSKNKAELYIIYSQAIYKYNRYYNYILFNAVKEDF